MRLFGISVIAVCTVAAELFFRLVGGRCWQGYCFVCYYRRAGLFRRNFKYRIMEVLDTARATTKGGRNGHVASSDGIIDLELRTPKEMGGESGYSNPEQLFAAGYAACFDSAMTMLARRKRLDVEEAEITVEVGIGKDPADGGFKLQADITGTFPAGITDEQAGELMEAAHGFCPYSKAVRGNIEVRLHHRVGR